MLIDSDFTFCCETGFKEFFDRLLDVVYGEVILPGFDKGADCCSIRLRLNKLGFGNLLKPHFVSHRATSQ